MHGLGDTLFQNLPQWQGGFDAPKTLKKMVNNNMKSLKLNSEKVWGRL